MAIGAAVVGGTRSGRAGVGGPTPDRLFVVDYLFTPGTDPVKLGAPKATVSASKGVVRNVVIRQNPATQGLRVSFELDPQNEALIELRLVLAFEAGTPAETWVYRWTS